MKVKYYPGALKELARRLPHLEQEIDRIILAGEPQKLVADQNVDYTQFSLETLLLSFTWENTPQKFAFWQKVHQNETAHISFRAVLETH